MNRDFAGSIPQDTDGASALQNPRFRRITRIIPVSHPYHTRIKALVKAY